MKASLFFLVLASLVSPVIATAANEAGEVRTVTLRNGLRIVLAPDSAAATADVTVWYLAGTRYEREGLSGITHLCERLMFRGSKTYGPGEHLRLLHAEGATVSTFTTADFSSFYQTLPPAAIDLALSLEADRMGSLVLRQADLDAERAVAHEENRRLAASSQVIVGMQQLLGAAFRGGPYALPPVGRDADLDRITLQDAKAYWSGRYGPNNAVLTVVGRFDPDRTLAAARKAFEPIPRRRVPPAPARNAAGQPAARFVTRPFAGTSPTLLAGWRALADGDPDAPAVEVLARLLAGGPGARLSRALGGKDGSEAYVVQGGVDARQEAGLLYAFAVFPPGADSARVQSAVRSEAARLATEAVTPEALARAERQVESTTLFLMQGSRGKARALGAGWVLAGDPRAIEGRLARLRRLTPADVQRVAARVLDADRLVLVWMPATGAPANAEGEGRP